MLKDKISTLKMSKIINYSQYTDCINAKEAAILPFTTLHDALHPFIRSCFNPILRY